MTGWIVTVIPGHHRRSLLTSIDAILKPAPAMPTVNDLRRVMWDCRVQTPEPNGERAVALDEARGDEQAMAA